MIGQLCPIARVPTTETCGLEFPDLHSFNQANITHSTYWSLFTDVLCFFYRHVDWVNKKKQGKEIDSKVSIVELFPSNAYKKTR